MGFVAVDLDGDADVAVMAPPRVGNVVLCDDDETFDSIDCVWDDDDASIADLISLRAPRGRRMELFDDDRGVKYRDDDELSDDTPTVT